MKYFKKIFLAGALAAMVGNGALAQEAPPNKAVQDTVVVNFGRNSQIIFQVNSQEDLETLKQYDLNALLKDISMKIEKTEREGEVLVVEDENGKKYLKDTTIVINPETGEENTVTEIPTDSTSTSTSASTGDDNDHDDDPDIAKVFDVHLNFDLGTNNYLQDGKFPDENNAPYTVRPWGSWYVGIQAINTTRVSKRLRLHWGVGVDWYNFKFEGDRTLIEETDDGLNFLQVPDTGGVDFKKSKLTVAYLSTSLVPELQFGKKGKDGHKGFRIGLGGYAGYRIDSYTKLVFRNQDNDKKKDKDHDNFFLNNFRYGLRLQLGFDDVDFFANYDLNELFIEDRGPKLNAFSFGVTF